MINNYEALDLGRYMKIDKILHTPAEEIDKQVQIIAVLADMPEDKVLLLPLADYSAMAKQTAFLGTVCDPVKVDGSPVVLDGLRLIPTKDFTKINTAQYVDFQTFAKDFPGTLPELLSCFLVPEGKAYNDGYDIAEVQKAVRTLNVPTAIGLVAFFLLSFSESIAASVTSLEKEASRDRKKAKEWKKKAKEIAGLLQTLGAGLPI